MQIINNNHACVYKEYLWMKTHQRNSSLQIFCNKEDVRTFQIFVNDYLGLNKKEGEISLLTLLSSK